MLSDVMPNWAVQAYRKNYVGLCCHVWYDRCNKGTGCIHYVLKYSKFDFQSTKSYKGPNSYTKFS